MAERDPRPRFQRSAHINVTSHRALEQLLRGFNTACNARRQRVQDENVARLDDLDIPRIELPELNPPVALGELKDLAAKFVVS